MGEPARGTLAATAIVLAGGRSARFGSDKLAFDFGGRPLLEHAILAVRAVCREVLVVSPPAGLATSLRDITLGTRLVLDQAEAAGPLVALSEAAPKATHEQLLLVGGDMPDLQPAVLRRLLAWREGGAGACLVLDRERQPMPVGLDRTATLAQATVLIGAGERSLRALIGSLPLELVSETEWRALDSGARSLRDIDRPEDLVPGTPAGRPPS